MVTTVRLQKENIAHSAWIAGSMGKGSFKDFKTTGETNNSPAHSE